MTPDQLAEKLRKMRPDSGITIRFFGPDVETGRAPKEERWRAALSSHSMPGGLSSRFTSDEPAQGDRDDSDAGWGRTAEEAVDALVRRFAKKLLEAAEVFRQTSADHLREAQDLSAMLPADERPASPCGPEARLAAAHAEYANPREG